MSSDVIDLYGVCEADNCKRPNRTMTQPDDLVRTADKNYCNGCEPDNEPNANNSYTQGWAESVLQLQRCAFMAKKRDYYTFDCPACGKGRMLPAPRGHRCDQCPHFENDRSTYGEQDRGEHHRVCYCRFCTTEGREKNEVIPKKKGSEFEV